MAQSTSIRLLVSQKLSKDYTANWTPLYFLRYYQITLYNPSDKLILFNVNCVFKAEIVQVVYVINYLS